MLRFTNRSGIDFSELTTALNNPRVISDIEIAQAAWKKLVRPANLYDEWPIRINFLDASEYALHILTDNPDSPTAMLPLQRSKADGSLRFIGSPFLERNRGFALSGADSLLEQLYGALPNSTVLDDISADDPACAGSGFRPSDPAYILERQALDYKNPDSLYRFLPKNIRENLRKIGRRITSGEISVTESDPAFTLDQIKRLQHARFGQDSWLESAHIYRAISNLNAISASIDAPISCILMQAGSDVIAGCISLSYQGSFYMLMASVNNSFSGLGSYLHYHCMTYAFDQGCERIDTGIGDCGWKERWGLRAVPQYLFEASSQRLSD